MDMQLENELEIPEYPLGQEESAPNIMAPVNIKVFKVEWLIVGALVFISVVAWAELLKLAINQMITKESETADTSYTLFIYALILTVITIISVVLL